MSFLLPDRVRASEVSAARIRGALTRRVRDVPNALQWRYARDARANRGQLEGYRDRHRGQTCVVVASGPSLARTDLGLVADLPTIAMNRSYLLYPQWGFMPTYYAAINSLVLHQFADDIAALPMPKFVSHNFRDAFDGVQVDGELSYLRFRNTFNDSFTPELTKSVCSGGTVTFACLEIAYFMGFSTVILIGLDHNYAEKGTPNTTEIRTYDKDESHAHPDYFAKGVAWELPDLHRFELAYAKARDYYSAAGRRIVDSTVDGHCTVFEKMDLREALAL